MAQMDTEEEAAKDFLSNYFPVPTDLVTSMYFDQLLSAGMMTI